MAKIFVTDREHKADVCCYEVDHDHQADLLYFIVDHEHQAKGDEK
jgi:hypothetical protein